MKRTYLTPLAAIAFATVIHAGTPPNTPVDLELSLVTDISGSVGFSQYQDMIDGYVAAFQSQSVKNAIAGGNIGAIAVNLVFFASSAVESIPFTQIASVADADAFATQVNGFRGAKVGGVGGSTDIADGITLGEQTINGNTFDGTRKVIDVAGDGTGSTPGAARDTAIANGISAINGIVIGDDPDGSLKQFYADNVIAGTDAFVTDAPDFAAFEAEILQKLLAEITGNPLIGSAPILAAIRQSHILVVRNGYQDINSRLFRLRSGERGPGPQTMPGQAYTTPLSDKGGMTKGAKDMLGPPTTIWDQWEVFGSVGYFTSKVDGQTIVPGQLSLPGYDVDVINGTVGIEYDLDQNWSIGGAIVGSDGEADLDGGSSIDLQDLGLAVYASYYRAAALNAWGTPGNFWADLLYGYNSGEYDSRRVTGGGFATGSTDTSSHLVEFNTGLNFERGGVVHGPYVGLAYLDGEVDAFTETGPGAVAYPGADIESVVSTLGYQASFPMQTGRGKVVPQVRAAWEHEFEDGPVTVAGLNLGEPDEDVAVLGAGVLWHFHPDAYAVLDYEARFGEISESHGVALRLGATF